MSDESRREVPALLVEQLALGELDEAEARRVREALGDDGDRALARIEASNREILADYPPKKLAADIRRRLEREQEAGGRSRRGWMPWVLAPTLVAAAAVAWVMVRTPEDTTLAVDDTHAELVDDGQPELTRIKGAVDPHLVIDRRTSAGHERLGAGEMVGEGDLLQLSYVPAGRREGVIVSIDGAGAVTLHHPAEPEGSPALDEGAEIPLGHSYELDDAPSFERFLFVTRDGQPPAVDEVLRAAEQLARDPKRAREGTLELPGEGWEQHALILNKASASSEGEAPAPTPAAEGEGGQ